MQSICFVFNKAPYGNHSGRELLDICLMSCAFDMSITVIFQNEGVLQLLENQQPEIMDIKNHSKTFKALELYGVETILIDKETLQQHNLSNESLLEIGKIVDSKIISDSIKKHDHCLMM